MRRSRLQRVHDLCDQFQEMPDNQPAAAGDEDEGYSMSEHQRMLESHLRARGMAPAVQNKGPPPLFGDSSDDELDTPAPVWYYLDSKSKHQGPVTWPYLETLGKKFPNMMVWKKGNQDWAKFKNIVKSMSGQELWYYRVDGEEYGPLGTWELVNLVTSGRLDRKADAIPNTATDDVWKPMYQWPALSMVDPTRGGYETVVPEMLEQDKDLPDHFKLHFKGASVVLNDVHKIDQDVHLTEKLDPWPDVKDHPPGEVLKGCAGPSGWGGFVPWRGLVGEVIHNWPESEWRLVNVEAPNPSTMEDTTYYYIVSTLGLVTYKHHKTAKKEYLEDTKVGLPPGVGPNDPKAASTFAGTKTTNPEPVGGPPAGPERPPTTTEATTVPEPTEDLEGPPLKKRKLLPEAKSSGGIVLIPRDQQKLLAPLPEKKEGEEKGEVAPPPVAPEENALEGPVPIEEEDEISGDEDALKNEPKNKKDFMAVPSMIWKPMKAPNRQVSSKWDLPGQGWDGV